MVFVKKRFPESHCQEIQSLTPENLHSVLVIKSKILLSRYISEISDVNRVVFFLSLFKAWRNYFNSWKYKNKQREKVVVASNKRIQLINS